MIILADSRMPAEAARRLSHLGEVLWLEPQPQVYQSIAAHPDIFFCQTDQQLVASPDIPAEWKNRLLQAGVELVFGAEGLGAAYPATARYNAVVAEGLLIHHRRATDTRLISVCKDKRYVHVPQAYTRCNLLPLGHRNFLCSDVAIEAALHEAGMQVLMIDPRQVTLQGHQHGFAGGCFGLWKQQLVCCGSLRMLKEEKQVRALAGALELEVLELFDGPMTDVGSIFFAGN